MYGESTLTSRIIPQPQGGYVAQIISENGRRVVYEKQAPTYDRAYDAIIYWMYNGDSKEQANRVRSDRKLATRSPGWGSANGLLYGDTSDGE